MLLNFIKDDRLYSLSEDPVDEIHPSFKEKDDNLNQRDEGEADTQS
jgi:hypothetical protein